MGIFDKFSKKATNSAVETVKEKLNDKLDTYSGIIKIGLTLGVIIFGSRKINQHITKQEPQAPVMPAIPYQQPIVINNYYNERGYIPNGGKRQGENHPRHQNRR